MSDTKSNEVAIFAVQGFHSKRNSTRSNEDNNLEISNKKLRESNEDLEFGVNDAEIKLEEQRLEHILYQDIQKVDDLDFAVKAIIKA